MRFRWMTLDDLERLKRPSCRNKIVLRSPNTLLAAKCRPMIVVSKNIRYMWIFIAYSYKSTEITRRRTRTWRQSYVVTVTLDRVHSLRYVIYTCLLLIRYIFVVMCFHVTYNKYLLILHETVRMDVDSCLYMTELLIQWYIIRPVVKIHPPLSGVKKLLTSWNFPELKYGKGRITH